MQRAPRLISLLSADARPPFIPAVLWPASLGARVFDRCVPPALNAVLEHVDVTRLAIDHVSVPRFVESIDLAAVVRAADVPSVAAEVVDEIGLPEMVRASTGVLASDTVRQLRRQGASADDRLTWHRARSPGPATGAGVVTRLLAGAVDLAVVLVLLGAAYAGAVGTLFLLSPRRFSWPDDIGWSIPVGIVAIALPYLTVAWSATGRTVGGALFGVGLGRAGGGRVAAPRALARATLCVLVPLGIVGACVGPRRRSLADVLFRTEVTYQRPPRVGAQSLSGRARMDGVRLGSASE